MVNIFFIGQSKECDGCSRYKLLALGPFLPVVMMIIIAALPVPQRALMLHLAHLHSKRNANHFQFSLNAPIVLKIFYMYYTQNTCHGIVSFFSSIGMLPKKRISFHFRCAAKQLLNLYWSRFNIFHLDQHPVIHTSHQ